MSLLSPDLPDQPTDFNSEQVLLTNASVSASTAVTLLNYSGRGILAWMEVTSGMPPGSASTTINLKVQIVSPVGTTRYFTVGTSGAKSASGCYAVAVYPGISSTAVANVAYNAGIVGRNMRLLASISTAAASFGCVISLGWTQLR